MADTLGRPWEEVLVLAHAGFDYLINSTAWWDLRESWFLQQQQETGRLVPTLSSPEPLHGMRLAHRLTPADTAHYEAIYGGRYLVAATASSGLICPMGYEFASKVSFEAAYRTARKSDWNCAQEPAPLDFN